eukprot:1395437-Amorphochlora_amoeboformis.AAC.1
MFGRGVARLGRAGRATSGLRLRVAPMVCSHSAGGLQIAARGGSRRAMETGAPVMGLVRNFSVAYGELAPFSLDDDGT